MCASRHLSARGLPAAASLRKFLPAVGYAHLPASRSSLFFLGPSPCFHLFMPALSCARHWRRDPAGTTHVCEALFPRASRPFRSYTFSHPSRRSEPWLHFDIILHVVLGYIHRTPGAISPHALCCLLVPSRFLWSLVRGLVSKGFLSPHARPVTAFMCCAWSGGLQHHTSSPFLVLPRAARVGRYLQSLAAPAVVSQTTSCFTVAESCCFSVSLCSMCCASHGLCLSLALLRGGHPRMQLNSATWSSSEGSSEPHYAAVFLLNTVRPPVSVSLAEKPRLPCLTARVFEA